MKLKDESGQTIIEAVIALAAISVIVTAITIAVLNAVNNSQFVKSQNLANKYAQQGMEYVRSVQAENIEDFANFGDITYSFGGNDSVLTPGKSAFVNVGSAHIRNIDFIDDVTPCLGTGAGGADLKLNLTKVTVVVNWSSGKCKSDDRFCHNTTLVSCIPYTKNVNVFP